MHQKVLSLPKRNNIYKEDDYAYNLLFIFINIFAIFFNILLVCERNIFVVITALISLLIKIGRMHLPNINSPMKAFFSNLLILGNFLSIRQ